MRLCFPPSLCETVNCFLAIFLTAVRWSRQQTAAACLPEEGSFLPMSVTRSFNQAQSAAQLMLAPPDLRYYRLQSTVYCINTFRTHQALDMRCGLLASDRGKTVSSQLTALHRKSITLLPLIVSCFALPISCLSLWQCVRAAAEGGPSGAAQAVKSKAHSAEGAELSRKGVCGSRSQKE